jgi:hypothetical protein
MNSNRVGHRTQPGPQGRQGLDVAGPHAALQMKGHHQDQADPQAQKALPQTGQPWTPN